MCFIHLITKLFDPLISSMYYRPPHTVRFFCSVGSGWCNVEWCSYGCLTCISAMTIMTCHASCHGLSISPDQSQKTQSYDCTGYAYYGSRESRSVSSPGVRVSGGYLDPWTTNAVTVAARSTAYVEFHVEFDLSRSLKAKCEGAIGLSIWFPIDF